MSLRPIFQRLLWPMSPLAFFAGLLFGIVLLSVIGRNLSDVNPFVGYERLHRYISSEGLFFPSASQLKAMVTETTDPEKILVIVGGSSVLVGNGQGVEVLWTRRLQERLGDAYEVVNLAIAGGAGQEFGGVIGQSLARDGRKLVYVMDVGTSGFGSPDGCQYTYVYWDAIYKNLIPNRPEAARRIQELEDSHVLRCASSDLADKQARGMLNSVLHFEDLWGTLGYTTLFTTWTFHVRQPVADFWAPRRALPDPSEKYQPGPVTTRNDSKDTALLTLITRRLALDGCTERVPGDLVEDTSRLDAGQFDADAAVTFPPEFRNQTITVLTYLSSYYRARLTPQERKCTDFAYVTSAERLDRLGYTSLLVGRDFGPENYDDLLHFTASGGTKLAEQLAPVIREKAAALGYKEAYADGSETSHVVSGGAGSSGSARLHALPDDVADQAVYLPGVLAQEAQARDAQRKADLAAIRERVMAYRDAHGHVPDAGQSENWAFSTQSARWIPELGTVPTDPLNESTPFWSGGLTYGYATWHAGCPEELRGRYFVLGARLEGDAPASAAPARDCNGEPLVWPANVYVVDELGDADAAARARDAKRMQDVAALRDKIVAYRQANGQVPEGTVREDWSMSSLGTSWIPQLGTLPVDPVNRGGAFWGGGFEYGYSGWHEGCSLPARGQYFIIGTQLEIPGDRVPAPPLDCNGNPIPWPARVYAISDMGDPAVLAQAKQARDDRRIADLALIRSQILAFQQANGRVPQTAEMGQWAMSTNAAAWIPGLPELPSDPFNSNGPFWAGGFTYGYSSWREGCTAALRESFFLLGTRLEQPLTTPRPPIRDCNGQVLEWPADVYVLNLDGDLQDQQAAILVRDQRRIRDLETLRDAISAYREANGRVPAGAPTDGWTFSGGGPGWIPELGTAPVDPFNQGPAFWGGGYTYGYSTGTGCPVTAQGQYFVVAALLEQSTASPPTPPLDCSGNPIPWPPGIYAISDAGDPTAFARATGARDQQRIADLAIIRDAILAYRDQQGRVPEPTAADGWAFSTDGKNWIPGLGDLPVDPRNQGGPFWGTGMVYGYRGWREGCPAELRGRYFIIGTHLEAGERQTEPPLDCTGQPIPWPANVYTIVVQQ